MLCSLNIKVTYNLMQANLNNLNNDCKDGDIV